MAIELKKDNPLCLNIELIDSNSCIGDSLSAINKTFTNLQIAELQMVDYMEYITNNLTLFNELSTKIVIAGLNIKSINDKYQSPYSLIKTLSSKWETKEFSVYYPDIIDINSYYQNTETYKLSALNWFSQNFPFIKFAKNQPVNVFISLKFTNDFYFEFKSGYYENCSPTSMSDNSLSCNGCGGDNRNAGCNIDGRGCINAYSLCKGSKINDTATYTCQGTIGQTYVYDNKATPSALYSVGNTGLLSIKYKLDLEDNFVSRIVKIKIKKGNSNWELI